MDYSCYIYIINKDGDMYYVNFDNVKKSYKLKYSIKNATVFTLDTAEEFLQYIKNRNYKALTYKLEFLHDQP